MKRRRLNQVNLWELETVSLNQTGTALVIIDQTKLPNVVEELELTSQEEIWQAIHLLQVRGAPAIGVAAAGGIYLAAREILTEDYQEFAALFAERKAYLASARPTAVNLFWALNRMEQVVKSNGSLSVAQIKQKLWQEAETIKQEDIAVCRRIGEEGFPLIQHCSGVLTHCNAGQLATVRYGTALAPIYVAKEHGLALRVFADETRPLLQGARLTAFELTSAGVDTTVICDNMAATVMSQGLVQAVLVGADRIAANGDVANKIGTHGVAILAKHFGIPFYVCAPCSTIDLNCPQGSAIPIEERKPTEITELWYQKPMAPAAAKVFNPAFDVTPAALITALITEKGVCRPEATEIKRLFEAGEEC